MVVDGTKGRGKEKRRRVRTGGEEWRDRKILIQDGWAEELRMIKGKN